MKTLHINVFDKIATYQKRDGCIVCGNSDYQIKFTFDDEWAAYDKKTAHFIWNGQYTDVEFTGDTCPVPKITNATVVKVGVYVDDLSTTTPTTIECKRSVLCGGEPPRPAPVVLSTFSLDGEYYDNTGINPTGTYDFEEGMTWGEWCASKYNTICLTCSTDDTWVGDTHGNAWVMAPGALEHEKPSNKIQAGTTYTVS